MRFFKILGVVVTSGLLLFATSGSSRNVEAAQFVIQGVATGAEEVPAVDKGAQANVRFVLDDAKNELNFAVTIQGMPQEEVTAAHIHRAARGTNGPIIHPLSLTGFTQVSGSVTLSEADVADLRAGNLYFNAHSKSNPAGFARFQLAMPGTPSSSSSMTIEGTASGAEEVPAQNHQSRAPFRFALDEVTKDLSFTVSVEGIAQEDVTAAHIHRGARGTNGPIIHALSLTSFSQVSGTVRLSDDDIADLRAGNFYVNIHSKANPAGFARMQLIPPPPPAPPAPSAPPLVVVAPRAGDGGLVDQSSRPGSASLALAVLLLAGLGIALRSAFSPR